MCRPLSIKKPSYFWELLSKADALGCLPDLCISVTRLLGAFKFQKNKLCTKVICSNTYCASDAFFACLCNGWGRKQAHVSGREGLSRVKTTIPYTMHIVFSSNLYGIDIFGGKGDIFWDFLIRFLQNGHSLKENNCHCLKTNSLFVFNIINVPQQNKFYLTHFLW